MGRTAEGLARRPWLKLDGFRGVLERTEEMGLLVVGALAEGFLRGAADEAGRGLLVVLSLLE